MSKQVSEVKVMTKTMTSVMTKADEFGLWLKKHHVGKDNAVKASDIKTYGDARELRLLVQELRAKGEPICSGNQGYYYAANEQELAETLSRLDSLIKETKKTYESLYKAYQQMNPNEVN